ncbi:Eco57I restriction-modification methylase domain-containing protein [Helicobacter turcicus]|uniref:Eco57I restriction-modification methylase domain-containing protein n=1 Tax=Helicobacter turcicus TaxID=2867412 RepID=A0ABS7JPI2_9HELI|nr:SNF2-related protein [Helicobacter turcicus]MBX7491280.1 Eco57I restriction-modification methylase domain-containing protein [Helicobacter turcicus]MBX7546081.1 Eco57I restriction-modification methylase domain-containing protein [Helicobacter turcicus]
MKALLTYSNYKNLSNIAIILESLDDELLQLLESQQSQRDTSAASLLQNDNDTQSAENLNNPTQESKPKTKHSLKSYILTKALENNLELFTELAEKPDFSEVIEEYNIDTILSEFEGINTISLAIKENGNFRYYDKDLKLQVENLLKENENAQSNRKNPRILQTNTDTNTKEGGGGSRDRQTKRGGDEPIRDSNLQTRIKNEPSGIRGERDLPELNDEARLSNGMGGTIRELQTRDEQREGELQRGLRGGRDTSAEYNPRDNPPILTKEPKAEHNPTTSKPRDNHTAELEFRARIRALLQHPSITAIARETLQKLHRKANTSSTEAESNSPKEPNPNTNQETRILRDSTIPNNSHRGSPREFESSRISEPREPRIPTPRDARSEIAESNLRTEPNNSLFKSTENSTQSLTNTIPIPPNISNNKRASNHPNITEGERDSRISTQSPRGSSTNPNASSLNQELHKGIQASDSSLSTRIPQEQTILQDSNPKSLRESPTSFTQQDSSNKQDNMPQSETAREDAQSLQTTQQGFMELGVREEGETPKNREIKEEINGANTGFKYAFKTFSAYEFLKKLDGEEYKGEIDFKLSLKQRISANLEALKLLQEIFIRKQRGENPQNFSKEELFEFTRLQAENIANAEELHREFVESKLESLKQEFKDKGYFSLECPYSKKEQKILAKYTGFGGLKPLFYNADYKEIKEEILNLVGEEKFKELRESSYNAYFTPSAIIDSMFKGLEALGIPSNEKITALEPSCGIGHFITKAPANYEFIAIEKDSISASIAKLLHPKTKIYNKAFEEVLFNREFDCVIGNPPYENARAEDSRELIHNYFVLKSQSLLKEGGLSSFVISSGFMDSINNNHRMQIESENILLSAFRLPNSSFKATHTEVLSDIVFFRKTSKKEEFLKGKTKEIREFLKSNNACFLESNKAYFRDASGELENINLNKYYFSSYHSDCILGRSSFYKNQFGKSVLRVKSNDLDLTHQITQKIQANLANFSFYNKAQAFNYEGLNLAELDLSKEAKDYINNLRVENLFEYNNTFYTKEENLNIKEAYFTDELELAKKYLINQNQILDEKKTKLTYKNPLNEHEKAILRKIIAFRDLLNANLENEKNLDSSEKSNALILEQKQQLRNLREQILTLSNTKAFNVNSKNKKDKDSLIKQHSLKSLIELEKLESFKIFAVENIIKTPKKDGFDYTYQISEILSKRILYPLDKTQASNPKEALQKTINDKGYIDLSTLQSYLPNSKLEDIIKNLLENALIFPNLDSFDGRKQYCLIDEFLSGNIKKKALQLEQMIKENHNFNAYLGDYTKEHYLNTLKENFPKDIKYEDLEINFGANYIPLAIYESFIKESFFNNPKSININIQRLGSEYVLESFSKNIEESQSITIERSDINDIGIELEVFNLDGNKFFSLHRLLSHTLNNKSLEVYHLEEIEENRFKKVVEQEPTKKAMQSANAIKDLFLNFIFKHKEHREEIEKSYNAQINVFSKRKFAFVDMLETPYLNKEITLRTHQKNAIFKGIMHNSLLLDHEVGAGKTLAGVALVMEQARMRLINKALVLVPNHLSTTWGEEFIRAYPNAKILVGDKIKSKKERKEFLYRARNGDFNAIVMKHSTFENMSVMESFKKEILQKEIALFKEKLKETQILENSAQLNKKETNKLKEAIDKKIKKLEKKLEKEAKGKIYDSEIAFEDLGIDCLVVDEAHYFKNLFINTNQENIKGIPSIESKKAMKMYCATQYIHNNKGKLYFLTGTPISNSIAEFYTMQRYLQPEILKELKLEHFDDWQRTFTNITLNEELDSSGVNYTLVNRLSEFINAPELINLYKQNADIVSTEDIEKINGRLVPKVKGGGAINIIAPRSEAIANFIGIEDEFGNYNSGSIIDRMNHLSDDPKRNNILVCTSEARKAALDFRLINHLAPDYEDSKINKMIALVKEHYEDKRYANNTQLIFCDLGVSKQNSQRIDINKEDTITQESIEQIAKELKLECIIERDEEDIEIKRYYVEYQKDEEGKIIEDSNGEKEIKKVYEVEELLNLQGNFDVYASILKKLVLSGIPQKQIAFIGDAKNDKAKQELFNKVNAGIIRILIGSSAKMGTGTNVQRRIVALHELDCPWKPSELEQRRGRGVRQGNLFFEMDKENFEIAHYRYATEQTYDARMFQINEQKLKPLIQMKKADALENKRVFKGIDEEMANIAEMKAIATGNPFILEKHKIENLLNSEKNYKKYYEKSILSSERALKEEESKYKSIQEALEALREMFNNKGFEQENYEVLALNYKTTKKANKQEDKNFQKTRNLIDLKLLEVIRGAKDYADKEGNIEVLEANNIKLLLRVGFLSDSKGRLLISGILQTQKGKKFAPNNLRFVFENGILGDIKLSALLAKIKNTLQKVPALLEQKSKELKECEDAIKDKKRFLETNTIENYKREPLLKVLNQDFFNINAIFKIRQERRKEGIKINLDSKEIAHLLPQYPKYLDSKGNLRVEDFKSDGQRLENKAEAKGYVKEAKEAESQNAKACKTEVNQTTACQTNPTTCHSEHSKESLKAKNKMNEEIKAENVEPKRVQETKQVESKKDSTLQIAQSKDKVRETHKLQEQIETRIRLKEFSTKDNLEDKMKILTQNMINIQRKPHSKRIIDRGHGV